MKAVKFYRAGDGDYDRLEVAAFGVGICASAIQRELSFEGAQPGTIYVVPTKRPRADSFQLKIPFDICAPIVGLDNCLFKQADDLARRMLTNGYKYFHVEYE